MVHGRVSLLSSDLSSLPDPPGNKESLVITRHIKKEVGEQMLVPPEYLRGIVPAILLLRYRFWQNGDGTMEGEWIVNDVEKTGLPLRVVFVQSDGGSCLKNDLAIITRPRTDRLIGNDVLLNLGIMAEDSPIASICRRLDNLSHVVAWGNQDTREIEEIEFPRLRLSFKRKGDKLVCEQHEGYWLLEEYNGDSNAFSKSFEKILQSLLGGSAILCAANGSKAIVVGSHVTPMRFGPGGHTVFRRDPEIVGHFFYPSHLSEEFVTTQSLMSSVHLLRTRWMARQYSDAVDTIPCVFADTVDSVAIRVLKNQPELVSDIHPDSHALRLRLILAILPFTTVAELPWNLTETMVQYLTRVRWCSAGVRLSLEDESYLLADVIEETGKRPILSNRLMWLRGM
jgi:hypothetical protein